MAKVLVDTDTGQTLTNKSITATGSGIANTLESRFGRMKYLTDYSSGFGTANDASKLQTAFDQFSTDGGGILQCHRGTFLIGTSVTIPSNIHLIGQGPGLTTFQATSTLPLKNPMLMGATGDTGLGYGLTIILLLKGLPLMGLVVIIPPGTQGLTLQRMVDCQPVTREVTLFGFIVPQTSRSCTARL